LITIENLIRKCPFEAKSYVDKILQLVQETINYDPNYQVNDEDDDEMNDEEGQEE
jgi:hypothetical protein